MRRRRRLASILLGGLVTAVAAAAVAAAAVAAGGVSLAATAYLVGPDVSSFQHPNGAAINWDTVFGSGGQSFAIVKATEGTNFTSPTFAGDWAKLQSKGVIRGTYHYARPTAVSGNAVAEARHYLAVAGAMNQPGHLPPILDLEETGGLSRAQLAAWAKAWLDEVELRTGRVPMIYVSAGFWDSYVNTTAFGRYPLHVAHYTTAASPRLPVGWSRWTLWQYTESASVAGIPARTDHNRFNGSLDQLRALARVGAGRSGTPKDVNGDGRGDVGLFAGDGPAVTSGEIRVYANGAGPRTVLSGATQFRPDNAKVALTNWDGDGDADIVLARRSDANMVDLFWMPADAGKPNWSAATYPVSITGTNLPAGDRGDYQVAGGDVNRDGKGDIVLFADNGGGGEIRVYANGAGPRTVLSGASHFRPGSTKLAVTDWDGDGDGDIVLARRSDANMVDLFWMPADAARPNWSAATYPIMITGTNLPAGNYQVAGGDVNGDGKGDAVLFAGGGTTGSGEIRVYANGSAPRTFLSAATQFLPGGTILTVSDWDGDGDGDLMLARRSATNTVELFWMAADASRPNWSAFSYPAAITGTTLSAANFQAA